jgi:hypothetical protein
MPSRRFGVACLLAAGCTSMHNVDPQQFIPAHKPTQVSVWTTRDDVTIVSDPRIVGDSLVGVVYDQPWATPLQRILRVVADAPDRTRTVLLLTGAAGALLTAYLLGNSGKGNGMVPCPPAECGQTVLPQ